MTSTQAVILKFIKSPIASLSVTLILAVLISVSYFWNQRIISHSTQQSFSAKGEIGHQVVKVLLEWTQRHQEIYVPVTPTHEINPYLSAEKKIITRDDGQVLTQISVARMLDQFSQSFNENLFILSLISNKPINPKNKANGWQQEIINNYFSSSSVYKKIIEQQFYYISPLTANESCFNCHQTSQLDNNNNLGAIVFSYDISHLLALEQPLHRQNIIIHITIFITILLIILLSLHRINRLISQLEDEQHNRDFIIEQKTRVLREEIQQHKQARNTLQKLSTHDPLTGIKNRRHLLETLTKEVKRYRRYNNDFSLLLIDIDHFKQINERFGDHCGDQVLAFLAQRMSVTLRGSDTLARYAGEEFAIIATNTPLDSALRFANKLVNDINQQDFCYNNERLALSISIGVTSTSLISKITNDLILTSADKALQAAKAQGRNCAVAASIVTHR